MLRDRFSFLFAILLVLLCCLSVSADAASEDLPPGYAPSASNVAGEKFEFQSDNKKVLNIVINSLYKSKDIFLRELVSNSADAIDKIRFQSLTKPDILGETTDLAIRIVADKERKLLIISDTGIGMTAEELKKNLGTIARSGTSEFVSLLDDKNADLNMIGQFGVGFYSVFLVCDRVTVASKNNNSTKQYIWESTSENDFTIGEDPRGNTLGRGTEITLHIKDDALEFLEEHKLGELIEKYSEYITFPIYLWKSKTETVDVDSDDTAEDSEVEDVSPKTPKTETRTFHAWEKMNKNKPIWARAPAELSSEDYKEFYKAFSKDYDEPMGWTHFKAEGDNDFKSILFIPKRAPSNFLQKLETNVRNIKLFVRRVFITDDTELFPSWLSFITGLVDSDDLPLNVSRETLQKHTLLKSIKKKMIAKAIEMIRSIANDESKSAEFFKQFGVAIKLGVVSDAKNKDKLTKILRFHSSHSDELTTLADYKKRMKNKQPQIYYITGANLNTVKNSPVVEVPLARGYEVLYMVDPMDEYLLQQALSEFDGTPLQSLSKSGLLYGDEGSDEDESIKDKFADLSEWLQSTLSEYVEAVSVSTRLSKSPTAVIANKMGLSGNMEKIMSAQALQTGENHMLKYYQSLKKTLEINPYHPVIKALAEKIEKPDNEEELKQIAVVLYESALIRSGFELTDAHGFVGRIEQILRGSLGVSSDAQAEYTVVPAKEREVGDDKKKKEDSADVEDVEHDE
ncbi:Hsp90 protein-domain-containing protein [Chytriomyces cf. hyalinus JEL632]|nr:Hsp90 protein-domain-containing protein [Chytriomyces cf. hyalinus JEL632]